jgi:hypothetical protein
MQIEWHSEGVKIMTSFLSCFDSLEGTPALSSSNNSVRISDASKRAAGDQAIWFAKLGPRRAVAKLLQAPTFRALKPFAAYPRYFSERFSERAGCNAVLRRYKQR